MTLPLIDKSEMKTKKNIATNNNVHISRNEIELQNKEDIATNNNVHISRNEIELQNKEDIELNKEEIKQNYSAGTMSTEKIGNKENYKKKLIEITLPLDIINDASSTEKSLRHGNISTMHIYWSRKPLSVAKAVLFASIIDDPINYLPEKEAIDERKEIFRLIKSLVVWHNPREYETLEKIKKYIANSIKDDKRPIVYDPFCGGGSIPFAAQILGLDAYGSDLNPIAVILTKSLIELPYKYKDQPQKNPTKASPFKTWSNAQGIAEDIRYYGEWMKSQAIKKIGHLYPKVTILGKDYTVIAWIFCREIKCPNPICSSNTPLVNKFWLSLKNKAWVEPIINKSVKPNDITYRVVTGKSGDPIDGTITRNGARCLCCNATISLDYIREQGKLGKLNDRPIGIVAEGERKRIYASPDQSTIPQIPDSDFLKDIIAPKISGYFNPPNYGYNTIGSMFNSRQRYALETFTKLVGDARQKCLEDCHDEEYAKIIATYLTLAVGRLSNRMSSFCIWNINRDTIEQTFSEQGVPMLWIYAEANPLSSSTGSWEGSLEWIPEIIESIPVGKGKAFQNDSASNFGEIESAIISTDPPYYSSITYADLSDYFYGIFRACLKNDFPDLFSTMTTPKIQEIVAAWHRFNNDRGAAGNHFRKRLKLAFKNIVDHADDKYPITIYYAFKEKEFSDKDDDYYTAWESILSVVIDVGLQIVRTWPIRTERIKGMKTKKNSLASSIVLVCRKRASDAPIVSIRELIYALKKELPMGFKVLQDSYIAPVDMVQSTVGLGMEIFSRYTKVLEADGKLMSIRKALYIINQELGNFLEEQESELDSETRFCLNWYEQNGWREGDFDDANKLSIARGTTVNFLVSLGIIYARAGRVRLLKREELEKGWDPANDKKITVWKTVQQLINILDEKGENGVADVIRKIGNVAEPVKDITYRLFSLCDKKGWAEDANIYNSLTSCWRPIMDKVQTYGSSDAGW